jgi:hypothetical protein
MDDKQYMAQLKVAQIVDGLETAVKEQSEALSSLKKALNELSDILTQE